MRAAGNDAPPEVPHRRKRRAAGSAAPAETTRRSYLGDAALHELSITNAILNTVVKHARREGARQVHRILLVVSELSDLQPVWIQHYFDRIAEGTVAHGARLEIERNAPTFACLACGCEFSLSLSGVERVRCPQCGGDDCRLEETADYVVEEIEVS